MASLLELRRHTDNDGDVLTEDGVRAALEIGASLAGGYAVLVSSGAQRATQTLACFLAGLGQSVAGGVLVEPGLRSQQEERWRAAARQAAGSELSALRAVDPELVEQDGAAVAAALRRVFDRLGEGERALAVGHTPTSEAGVYALTGLQVAPLDKGHGVLLVLEDAEIRVEPLEP